MDKRWIGILIILIAGLGAMYLIVDSSTTIGTASAVAGDLSIVVPSDMKIGDSGDALSTSFYNPNNKNTIYIKFLGKGDTSLNHYNNFLAKIKNKNNIVILENTSNNTIHTVHYQNLSSKNPNKTMVFFSKENRTVSMKLVKYTDENKVQKDIDFIIANIKHDYKQSSNDDEYKEFTV